MNKTASFSKFEKEFSREMRNKINTSEDKIDLENHFSCTVSNMLRKIFEDKNIRITNGDIYFDPSQKHYYRIDGNLLDSKIFKTTWENSDLQSVINRIAASAYHKYVHMKKHPEKTEKKIRN